MVYWYFRNTEDVTKYRPNPRHDAISHLKFMPNFGPLTMEHLDILTVMSTKCSKPFFSIETTFASDDVYCAFLDRVLPLMRYITLTKLWNPIWQNMFLTNVLQYQHGLTWLSLNEITMAQPEATLLRRFMETTTTLQNLNLSYVTLVTSAVFNDIAAGFKYNQSIQGFCMSNTNLDDDCLVALADAMLFNETVLTLIMVNNKRVSELGFTTMSNMLQCNNTLLVVNLTQWKIDWHGLASKILEHNLSILELSSIPVRRNELFAKNQGFDKLMTLLCAFQRSTLYLPPELLRMVAFQLANLCVSSPSDLDFCGITFTFWPVKYVTHKIYSMP